MVNNCLIHNPNCSKSKEALTLLHSNGFTPKIIDYLGGELSSDFLKAVIQMLEVPAKNLLRTKEVEFQSITIDLESTSEIIETILAHPNLLERPIFVNGGKAVIGRPPHNVLKIL